MKTRDVECIAIPLAANADFADNISSAQQPIELTQQTLQAIFQHATAAQIARFHAPLLATMATAQINTPLRQAHFLAQVGHESGELRYTEELASGAAYEGRKDLGNTQPGDGKRFKGRGLIQLTGRANYTAFGASIAQDLCTGDTPTRVSTDPALCVAAATWFWTTHSLNALADRDDLQAITRTINGGTNGLQDRQRLLDRAKQLLLPAVQRVLPPTSQPVALSEHSHKSANSEGKTHTNPHQSGVVKAIHATAWSRANRLIAPTNQKRQTLTL